MGWLALASLSRRMKYLHSSARGPLRRGYSLASGRTECNERATVRSGRGIASVATWVYVPSPMAAKSLDWKERQS